MPNKLIENVLCKSVPGLGLFDGGKQGMMTVSPPVMNKTEALMTADE